MFVEVSTPVGFSISDSRLNVIRILTVLLKFADNCFMQLRHKPNSHLEAQSH